MSNEKVKIKPKKGENKYLNYIDSSMRISGDNQKLKEMFREKLIKCGWYEHMSNRVINELKKTQCVDQLYANVRREGILLIPENIEEEMKKLIKEDVKNHDKIEKDLNTFESSAEEECNNLELAMISIFEKLNM